jgi:uncharacterized membrane protein YhaH (DUF805 family)
LIATNTEQRPFLGRSEAAMDTKWLLSRFEGRTSRARYWLAVLILLASMVSALLLLATISEKFGIAAGTLSINLVGVSASVEPGDDDTAVKVSLIPQLVVIAMTLVFGWFYLAASIRRLHDRNKSGWWIIPFVGATGPFDLFGHRLAWAAFPVRLAVLIAFIWGLVEMYGLRGTNGPNRFGSDPLAPADPIDTRPPWDQQSELEFVPHKAGLSAGATGVPGKP